LPEGSGSGLEFLDARGSRKIDLPLDADNVRALFASPRANRSHMGCREGKFGRVQNEQWLSPEAQRPDSLSICIDDAPN
jgi:hypothetical protein